MSPEFFTVHSNIPRQGPGLPEDVHWALEQLARPPMRVLDGACGPGADTLTLAQALPEARIDAIEMHAPFIEESRVALAGFEDRVRFHVGDMFAVDGPFDLIWSAGAVYFVGVTEALSRWRGALAQGGAVVFSEPALATDAPTVAHAFWEEYPAITDEAGVLARVDAAGYDVQATRLIIGAAWDAYYTPMAARITELRSGGASDALEAACKEAEQEIAQWNAARDHIAYLLVVATPRDV